MAPHPHHKLKPAYLVLIALFVVVGTALGQDTARAFSGGSGSATNPYLIGTCAELQAINASLTAHFKLTGNLACGQTKSIARSWSNDDQWIAEGYKGFGGVLDGNGKTITFQVTANPNDACQALFCYVTGSIYNLTLNGTVSGSSYVGALAGIAGNGARITNITSGVAVTGAPSSGSVDNLGGMVGTLCDAAHDCAFNGNTVSGAISVNSPGGAGFIGGMVGSVGGETGETRHFTRNRHTGTVNVTSVEGGGGIGGLYGTATDLTATESSNTGAVTVAATHTSDGQVFQIGGLIGYGDNIGADNSYNSGSITGTAAGNLGTGGHSFGGLIGYGTAIDVRRAYNAGSITVNGNGLLFEGVGGLIGFAPDDTVIHTSFNAGPLTSNATSTHVSGAVVGHAPDGTLPFSSVYFDINRSRLNACIGNASPAGCTGVNGGNAQPNYFLDTTTNPPLNTWNFSTVWQPNPAAFPSLRTAAAAVPAPAAPKQQAPAPTVAQETETAADLEEIVLNDISDFSSAGGAQLDDLELGQVLRFYVPVGDSDEEHTATISQIGENFTVVTLASTPVNHTIYNGETVQYELTKDKKDDLEIHIRGIEAGQVDATFRLLGVDHTAAIGEAKRADGLLQSKWIQFGGPGLVAVIGLILIKRWRRRRLLRRIYETHWPGNDPDLREG